MKLSCLKEE